MKKILIITTSVDNECIEMVTEDLQAQGAEVIRFNTDLYPSEISLSSTFENGKWKFNMRQDGIVTDLTDLHAVWYRRMNIAGKLYHQIEKKYYDAAKEESRRTFLGTISALDTFILDYHWKIKYADLKLRQLKIASQIGLDIPTTTFTNDAELTKDFYKLTNQNMITKMQSSFAIYESGIENVVFTNKISEEDMQNLDGLQYCPMTFQDSIDKKVELRVTVVGDKIFTASIDPSMSEKAANDWRKEGVNFVKKWKKYDLPREIEEKILKLMDYFQLNYGAIDIIVTNDDRYVFLEINPAGEFFWLNEISDTKISTAIANVLLQPELRRANRHAENHILEEVM